MVLETIILAVGPVPPAPSGVDGKAILEGATVNVRPAGIRTCVRHAPSSVSILLQLPPRAVRSAERPLKGRVGGVAEQPEAGLVDFGVLLHRRAGGVDGRAGAGLDRVAVDAGRDRGEGDAGATVLGRELDRAAVAGGEQLGLALFSSVPDGTDGVNHVLHRQAAGAGDLRVAGLAAAERAALLE